MSVAEKILATVDAPYGTGVSAGELAVAIADTASVETCFMPAFSFFSEVKPELQQQFIAEMEVPVEAARAVARGFQTLAGYKLPLAA